jgi:hypothetical protein
MIGFGCIVKNNVLPSSTVCNLHAIVVQIFLRRVSRCLFYSCLQSPLNGKQIVLVAKYCPAVLVGNSINTPNENDVVAVAVAEAHSCWWAAEAAMVMASFHPVANFPLAAPPPQASNQCSGPDVCVLPKRNYRSRERTADSFWYWIGMSSWMTLT